MRAAGGPSCRLHRFGCFRHRRRNPRNKGEPMAQHVQTTQTHPLQGSKDHKINKNPKNNFLLVMTYHQQFQIVFQRSAWLVGHSCCSTAQRSDFWVPAVGTKKYMNLWGTLPWIPICWNTTKTMNDKKQDPKTKKEHASEKKTSFFPWNCGDFLEFSGVLRQHEKPNENVPTCSGLGRRNAGGRRLRRKQTLFLTWTSMHYCLVKNPEMLAIYLYPI